MQGNILGQGGSNNNNLLFPIYQQMTEPSKKSGIWIKSNEKIKDIYFQNDLSIQEKEIKPLPYDFAYGYAVSIGTDIYMFSSGTSTYKQMAYRYDTIEEIFTKLQDIPSYLTVLQYISTETDIYLFDTDYLYKYDITTDTYTQITMYTKKFYNSAVTSINTDLYLFGSKATESERMAYKYDSIQNIFTKLEDLPGNSFTEVAEVIDENNIAIFEDTNGNVYIYNIITNNYTKKNIIKNNFSNVVKINDMIYLLSEKKCITKYNNKEDSFYQYENLSNKLYGMVTINNKLYGLGGLGNDKLFLLDNKISNKNNGIYIITNNSTISKNMDIKSIVDTKKISNGEEQEIETYIGDGTEWKKLE